MIEAALDPKLINTLKGHKDQITAVHFHPQRYQYSNESKQIVSGSNDSMVFVWNLNYYGSVFKFLGHKDSITDVKFSPVGNQIASASKD
jgi:WD40 repeat protein